MIGRKVQSSWHNVRGTVVRWEPLSAALCDVLIQREDGRNIWLASTDCKPTDGRGPLPSRADARERARTQTLAQLNAIRAQFVEEFRTVPWPGTEFGKGHFGRALDGAIADVARN